MPPFDELPSRTFTLKDFCKHAKALEPLSTQTEFIEFVATGQFHDETSVRRQAIIDPLPNLADENLRLSILRDYDSMIGITSVLPMNCPILVFPIPNSNETISKNNHLTHSVEVDGERTTVPLCKIPNIQFGMWGLRNSIHLFFPKLYREGRSARLTKEEKAEFYEHGLRPVVEESLPCEKNDWPPSLDAEMFRAKKDRGGLSLTSKTIPGWIVPLLPGDLEEKLREEGVDWAEGMFFLLTIRGVKSSNRHRMDIHSATTVLNNLLNASSLTIDALEDGEWYIDVGLEIWDEGNHCLQWCTQGHRQVIQTVLQISERHAERITSIGSSKYSRDLSSHLTGVSGCRIQPGVNAQGPFKAVYLQLYATDKSVTYHPEGYHYAKAMKMNDALGKRQPPTFIDELFATYMDARGTNSSNARIEVRVPIDSALTALMDLDTESIRSSLCAFTTTEWWSFRAFRLQAFSKIFSLQSTGSPEFRSRPDALLLTAACLWLLNSLHARPEDGPAARRLMDAVLPVVESDSGDPSCFAYRVAVSEEPDTEEEEDSDEEDSEDSSSGLSSDDDAPPPPRRRRTRTRRQQYLRRTSNRQLNDGLVPYMPFGVIFLRSLKIDVDVPRMRAGGVFIGPSHFKFWFNCFHEDIIDRFNPEDMIRPADIATSAITRNRMRQTTDVNRNLRTPVAPIFSLASRGIVLTPPAVDGGSDVEDEDVDNSWGNGDIDRVITEIYRQFLADLANKAPNMGGASRRSYLRLTEAERVKITEDLYQNKRLSKHWRRVQYFPGEHKDWKLAMGHLWPKKDTAITSNVQNYRQSRYFKRWRRLCKANDAQTIDSIRDAIMERIWSKFKWIPHAASDRIWATGPLARFHPYPKHRSPRSGRVPAPRILTKAGETYEWMDVDADSDAGDP